MSRKSMRDKGYDFEEGRQVRRDEKEFNENFMEGLGVPKPSKPPRSSRSSGSSGGGGFGGSGLAGIGIGGVVFLFFVLLCLFSIGGDAIDSLDQSDEIKREKLLNDIDNMKEWIRENNYCWGLHVRYYAREGSSIWVVGTCEFGSDGIHEIIFHSADAGDNWRILWSDADKDKIKEESNWYILNKWSKMRETNWHIVDIQIFDKSKEIRLYLSPNLCRRFEGDRNLHICALCTHDGGKTWRIEAVSCLS